MTRDASTGGQPRSGDHTVDAVTPLAALILNAMDDFRAETGVELTQSDIARRSGLDKRQISNYLKRGFSTPPTADRLRALAKGLGKSEQEVTFAALRTAGYKVPPNQSRSDESDRRIG